MNSSISSPAPAARFVAILAAILSLPAVVVPFVSFVIRTSPLDVVIDVRNDWAVALLGLPFFLGIPIVILQIARVVFPRVPRSWSVVGAVLAAGCVAMELTTIGRWLLSVVKGDVVQDVIGFIAACLMLVVLAIGGSWLWRIRKTAGGTLRAAVALDVAFLANALLCLIAFCEDRPLGWWLTLVACIGIALDATLVVIGGHRSRERNEDFDAVSVV